MILRCWLSVIALTQRARFDNPSDVTGLTVPETPLIHSAATLRFFLLKGRARLEPLRIFDFREVEWQGFMVTFYVLGTSHAVLVEMEEAVITELLTCAANDPKAFVLEQGSVSSDWSVARRIGNLMYNCRLSRFELGSVGGFRGSFLNSDQLTFTYGLDNGAGEALTRIGWKRHGTMLSVETLHTYPREGCGVRSESTFRVLARS